MVHEPQEQPGTRERLLRAAAEVYAEQGYRNARVREICDRAGANVAAINYHFGDKQRLYHEALRYAFFNLSGPDPTQWDLGEKAKPEDRLYSFVHSLLMQLLSEGRSALYAKLVAREMFDPTPALERVIEDGIRPQVDVVLALVRDALGKDADDQQVRRCAASIFGQCLFYYFARPLVLRIPLEEDLDSERVEALARHVTQFSLAALRQLAREGGR